MILHVKSELFCNNAAAREKLSQLCEPENVFARRWVEGGCKSAIRVHPVCRRLRRRQVGQVGGGHRESNKRRQIVIHILQLWHPSQVSQSQMSAQDHWKVFVINHQGQSPILRNSIFRREVLANQSSEDKGAKEVWMNSSRGNIAYIYHSYWGFSKRERILPHFTSQ